MPWIKDEDCIGCGICVKKCPVGAITIVDKKAKMNFDDCIRCGICHDVCPKDAIRHDSERIPIEVQENMDWIKSLMKHFKTEKEKREFIVRIKKFFNKKIVVANKTLEKIDSIEL